MGKGSEQHHHDGDGWPLPSPDVRRELEPPAIVWTEPDPPPGSPPPPASPR